MSAIKETVYCGSHSVRSEGNLLFVKFVGQLEFREYEQIRQLAELLIAEHGGIYMLGEVQKARGIVPEVRRGIVLWMKTTKIYGFANINASMNARGLATLLINAIRLVTGIATPMVLVGTEAEARAWVVEQEKKRLSLANA